MIHLDPRFLRGVDLFNEREYFDAPEEFEELFFEAIQDEVEFVRVFLQISVGMFHLQMKQWRPGIERLGEAPKAMDRVSDSRGYEFGQCRLDVEAAIEAAKKGERRDFRIGLASGEIDAE